MTAQKGYILPLVLFGSVAVLSGIGLLFYFFLYRPPQVALTPLPTPNVSPLAVVITDFESCVRAGNPVMESYPRKCNAGGKTFAEVVLDQQDVTQSSVIHVIDDGTAKEYINYLYNYQTIFDSSLSFEEQENGARLVFNDQITLTVSDTDPEDCRGDCSRLLKSEMVIIAGQTAPVKKLYWQSGSIGGVIPQRYVSLVFKNDKNKYFILEANELKFSSTAFNRSEAEIKDVSPEALEILNAIASSFRMNTINSI